MSQNIDSTELSSMHAQLGTNIVNDGVEEVEESFSARRITADELGTHCSHDAGIWIAIAGNVYDVTAFLQLHPGGDAILTEAAGTDVTEDFFDLHSEEAEKLLPKYHIGKLSSSDEPSNMVISRSESTGSPFLQRDMWKKVVLHKKVQLSHDARLLTLKWDAKNQEFGLPVGKHILLRLTSAVSGDNIIRAYTPISARCRPSEVDLVVKIYRDTDERMGGKMTTAIELAQIGSAIELKGPIGNFEYNGQGNCSISSRRCHVKRFIMISAGSGITPMIQVLRAIADNANDSTECLLLNGNRREDDILCKDQLDTLSSENESQFRIIHTLSSPSDRWRGYRGRLGQGLLEAVVGSPTPGNAEVVLLCGPPPMQAAVTDILLRNGWKAEDIVMF